MHGTVAVLFDLDDTLIDWTRASQSATDRLFGLHYSGREAEARTAYEAVLAENRRSFLETGRWWFARDRFALLCSRLGGDADLLCRDFAAAVPDCIELLPGARQAVEAARARGPVGLLTNGPGDVQRPKLVHVDGWFDHVAISGETGHWKPDAAAFEHALRALDVAPEDATMVGDSLHFDIRPAKALGMQTVWVARDGGSAPEADVVVRRPDELVTQWA